MNTPSFFLLVPGPFDHTPGLLGALAQAGVLCTAGSQEPPVRGELRVEVIDEPEGFAAAMYWGPDGPVPEAVVQAAGQCTKAALLEICNPLDAAREQTLALLRALQALGAASIRAEASGLSCSLERFIERLEDGSSEQLVTAAVAFVAQDERSFFSVGMQHFGLPDVELQDCEAQAALNWLHAFCRYCIDESPVFGSGSTFAPAADASRRSLERWPDLRHPAHDGRHNPQGVWVALPEGAPALELRDPEPVHIPALVAILMSQQQQLGRPLTQAEVEAVADEAPTIEMELGAARAMDRSRGYVDLEPRRAWEQWCRVRDMHG
ncbi:MAG: hypothetical protein VX899_12395 [Myxococcota bacterium]|nr:hypothetical protein [Myxococcota bacterium]